MSDEKKAEVKLNKDGLEAGAIVSQADHAKVLLKHRKEAAKAAKEAASKTSKEAK